MRQPGFEPGMSRGLNPPYMPFYYKRVWYLRWESNPQKTWILSPAHTPVLLRRYVGISERIRTSNFTDLNRLRLPIPPRRYAGDASGS